MGLTFFIFEQCKYQRGAMQGLALGTA